MTNGYRLFLLSSFLCGKKMMRRRTAISVALAAVVVSCGLREIGVESDGYEDVWTGPGNDISAGAGPVKNTVWYATGIDYPDEYDWRSDSGAGTVKCSLVVFANGVPKMKVPVGDEFKISADPDMHRMIDGNLYTDFSDDSLTVIKKDGKFLFQYPGREMMVAMDVQGEDVYTLGRSRSGQGFSFRRNGEILMSSTSGYAFSHLIRTDLGYAFAYSEPIMSSDGPVDRYYSYVEGEVAQIAVREDIRKVWDAIPSGSGEISYLASLVGISNPVVVSGTEIIALDIPLRSVVKNCNFISDMDGFHTHVLLEDSSLQLTSGIWKGYESECLFPSGSTAFSISVHNGGIYCIATDMKGGSGIIYRSGEMFYVPEGYKVMGVQPITVVDGIMYVGLASVDGDRPAVWKDGEIEPLKFNGYISSLGI